MFDDIIPGAFKAYVFRIAALSVTIFYFTPISKLSYVLLLFFVFIFRRFHYFIYFHPLYQYLSLSPPPFDFQTPYDPLQIILINYEFKPALKDEWLRLNPGFECLFFNDSDDSHIFLQFHYGHRVVNIFNDIIPGAFKADIFRIPVL